MDWQEDLCLQTLGWTVTVNGRAVLQDVDLEVPAKGSVAVLGPSGSGKSALLHLLSASVLASPHIEQRGQALYLGRPIAAGHAPPLARLSARMLLAKTEDALLGRVRQTAQRAALEWRDWLTEAVTRLGFPELAQQLDAQVVSLSPLHQRVVAIAREVLAEPPALLVEDMGKDLDDYDRFLLLDFVHEISADRGVLVAVGHLRDARRVPGQMLLMANGEVVEAGDLQAFIDDPQTTFGSQFVSSGLNGETMPPQSELDLDDLALAAAQNERAEPAYTDPAPPVTKASAQTPVPASLGPRGFYWLLPGQLAGMPLPGLVADVAYDLAALRRCGVTQVLSLSQLPLDEEALAQAGLRAMHLGGANREVPSVAQLRMLVRAMARWIERGQTVAVHCLSGSGRTGVLLTAYLMHMGATLEDAESQVRAVNSAFELNEEQRKVLRELESSAGN